MADRKITDLTALTTPASNDVLPIVDVSEAAAADKNKKITVEELLRGAPDGTAAAPGIGFEADPNTGIYRPGADQLAISTNGTGRLFIDASGNVGVGQSGGARGGSGTRFLSKLASGQSFIEVQANGTADANALIFSDGSTGNYGAYGYDHSNDSAYIQTAGQTRLTIDSSGRLGLGTSSAQQKLHVSSADSSATYLRVDNTAGQAMFGVDSSGNAYAGAETNDAFGLVTNGTYRMYITAGGSVGIGTQTPGAKLTVLGGNIQWGGADVAGELSYSGSDPIIGSNGAFPLRFYTNGSERFRCDSSGRVLVGTSSTSATCTAVFSKRSDGAADPVVRLEVNSTSPADGTALGGFNFASSGLSGFQAGARIAAVRDGGTWTNGSSHPTYLEFSTTADGASSPTERMRITSAGVTTFGTSLAGGFGKTTVYPSDAGGGLLLVETGGFTCSIMDRQLNDGTLISFKQASTEEGSISVSGTTVSYNGAHLSRWSQLPGGAVREEILRGTVLSNIDEMCDWGEEENEQLNRMKVSDVEGDKNVSGVFQAWDDDDDTYTDDFYCAMTGDFVIRIAQGVTVERGDLLMSAGDGTAKPQEDDIIRSKTVAKVTSTHVSETYDDGSYCVPCVLMAC